MATRARVTPSRLLIASLFCPSDFAQRLLFFPSASHTRSPVSTMTKKTGHDELVRRARENGFEANLSQYDSNPVRKKLKPNSQAQYDRTLEVWEAYASRHE
jgi:hypothetical protein